MKILALCLGVAIALMPVLSASAVWFPDPPDDRISFDEGNSTTPAIAAAGNAVYVVWSGDVTDPSTDGINPQIELRRSFDGGRSFVDDPPILVSDDKGSDTDPDIAVNGENVYIVWAEDDVPDNPGNPEICFAFSNDGGANFNVIKKAGKDPCKLDTKNLNLSNTPKADSIFPSIAVNGSNIYVAWSEFKGTTGGTTQGGFQITLAQSKNGGKTFDKGKVVSAFLLSSKDADALHPDLAVSGSILYGVWMDDSLGNFEIAFKQLTGKCPTQQQQQRQKGCPVLNLSNSARDSIDPVIAVRGKNLYVAWADKTDGDFDIFFTVSHNGGATFSTPQNVSKDNVDSLSPALAVEGTRVYLAWVDFSTDQGQIKFVRSLDSGKTFKPVPENPISGDRTNAQHPALAASGSKVFLAWADDLDEDLDTLTVPPGQFGASAIFFRFSNATGMAPIELTEAEETDLSIAHPLIHADRMHFSATGTGIGGLRVEIFNQAGRVLLRAEAVTNALEVQVLDSRGRPLPNGVYLCVITVLDADGRVMKREVRKLVILR